MCEQAAGSEPPSVDAVEAGGLTARIVSAGPAIAVAVGVAWAFVSALALAGPNRVPVNVLDWVAVVSFSVALAILAPGMILLAELGGRTRAVRGGCLVVAIGAIVAAFANFIEDGLGVAAFGDVFAAGLAGILVGLPFLAIVFAVRPPRWLAAVAVATFAGMFASSQAGGGFLVLAAWLIVAVALRRKTLT
jgi:hypothetical protein